MNINPKGKRCEIKKGGNLQKAKTEGFFARQILWGKGRYHFDYIIVTTISVTWYTFNEMWHLKVITHSHCRGCCGGADRLGRAFFLPFGSEPLVGKQTFYEAPVGPLGAGWMMGRGVDTASLALMRWGDLVGMTEGSWTRAQSGDCLSVQPVPLGFYPWVGISKEYAWPLTFSPTFVLTHSVFLFDSFTFSFLIYSLSFIINTFLVSHQSCMLYTVHIVIPCCTLLIFSYALSPFLPNSSDLDSDQTHCGVRDQEWEGETQSEK